MLYAQAQLTSFLSAILLRLLNRELRGPQTDLSASCHQSEQKKGKRGKIHVPEPRVEMLLLVYQSTVKMDLRESGQGTTDHGEISIVTGVARLLFFLQRA